MQNEFDPAFTWNVELALRSQWLDERLTVNANVFYTDWNDQQITIFGTSGSPFDFRTENAGSSRLFGGEIEVRAQPLDNLDLFAGFGYANTEFTDFVSGGNQLAGNEFPFASKYTASFGGTYYFDMGTYVSVDAGYQSKAYGDVENTEARESGRDRDDQAELLRRQGIPGQEQRAGPCIADERQVKNESPCNGI